MKKAEQKQLFDKKRTKIIQSYIKLKNKLGVVKLSDLDKVGHSKDVVQYYFYNLTNLDNEARSQFPDKFNDVRIDKLYTPKTLASVSSAVSNKKRFVITTAVMGCSVDQNFYKSIKKYCNMNDAELLVLLAADPAASVEWTIDRTLESEHIVFEEIALNSNIFLSTIKLSAKHIDPTTGLQRIGQRNGSFIYASPKQRLAMVPVSNTKLPHALMTTGAITKARYGTTRYMSERTAYIADNDHVIGAVIVEIEDDQVYHFRQIQSVDGKFTDLGVKYFPNKGPIKDRPVALVLGDWHAGETDPSCKQAILEMISTMRPHCLILHDAFNGLSINHHEDNKKLLKASRANNNQLSLENELLTLMRDLDELTKLVSKVVVVKSNHDEFLERYLDEGRYVDDPQNKIVSLKLALAMACGKDPLRYAVHEMWPEWSPGGVVKWLKRDEDFRIAGIQLGAHGDLGANGARGSLRAMEHAYGNSVSGHSHTPEILRGAWRVGTSSLLKLTYNRGASSWLHTHCLVYENGSRQLVSSIDGRWRLNEV